MVQVKKALVVDDSRLARIALSKLLQRRNVDVDTVATGTEALNYLQTTRPDVVFMDYMMPDMDGFEATRRIRSMPGKEDIPIVMYTAQESEADRERAEALGIVGFLAKPSGEESLEEILESLGRLSSEPNPTKASAKPPPPVHKAPEAPLLPAAAEPAQTPATQAEPAQQIDWQKLRNTAREAAEAKAIEVVEQLVQQRINSLREELEGAINKAAEAAQDSSNTLVEKTARRIAQDSAREAIERFGKTVEATPADKIKADMRRELRGHMAELLAADVFRHQFTEIVLETALPRLRDEVVEKTLPHIRDGVLEDAQRLARDTAAQAARDATSEQIAVSLTEYRMQDNDRVRELVQASTARLRRSLYICAGFGVALIIAGVAASVYLSTQGVPF